MALIQSQPKFIAEIVRMPLLKKLFWLYFLLLFFEGALRKWILPQFSAPLLIIRDPIALLIIWEAYRRHKWPKKWAGVIAVLIVMLIGLAIMQVIVVGTPWFIVVYGLRSYLLPFPVAFVMGESLDGEDLRKFAVCTLWLLLPLTLLEVVQYSQPSTSIWNTGASEGSVQLAYAAGHVRASATFSYVTGPIGYLPLAAAFIFFGLAKPGFVKRWLLWASSCALVLAVPITGSRTVVFELAAVTACVGIAAAFGVSQFVKSIQLILAMAFVALLVSQLPIFAESTQTLVDRFTEATAAEGGSTSQSFLLRLVDPTVAAVSEDVSAGDWLGQGMGYGAAAVAQLLTGQQFGLVGEEESERVLGEFGWPCGLAFLLFRLFLAAWIAAKAIANVRRHEPLAWLLIPLTFPSIFINVLEQPTEQGFTVIATAFSLAALRQGQVFRAVSAIRDPRQWRQIGRAPIGPGHHPRPQGRLLTRDLRG